MLEPACDAWMFVPVPLVLAVMAAYLLLALRQSKRARRWSRWRTISFLGGGVLLVLGFSPRLLPFAQGDFRKHMLQHLLLAMFAPIGLVMAAPMTLLLRSLPSRHGKVITGALRTPGPRILTMPAVALLLDFGGMAALYFTPLYKTMLGHPGIHSIVDLHLVTAGCLYACVIAGPDPSPHRPSVPARLVVLGLAVVIHSVLSQLLYAGWHIAIPAPAAQLQQSAELMYYGGDISEIVLAFALVTTWYPARPQAVRTTLDLPADSGYIKSTMDF